MENTRASVIVRQVNKSFGAQRVLDGIDLEVQAGKTLAMLGRSGTGKSVFLKLLIGLHAPDSGSIHVCGEEITKLDIRPLNEVRKRVGFLFQQGALYDSLTVEQNVEFPLLRHTKLPAGERHDRVVGLLASVGMEKHRAKMPSEISGGMQKRVGLARALALDPEVLLFDEPTAGLDPITAAEIGALIRQLQEKDGMTAVVVTHDLHGARAFCDRVVVLHEGHIVVEGTFNELERSRDQFVVRFLRDAA